MQLKALRDAIVVASVIFIAGATVPARAQVMVDMARITCGQFMDYAFDKQEVIGAWMSGYFNASLNRKILDIARYQANSKRVSNYCKKHKNNTLMNAVQKVAI
ncbi:MAG: HdeA/HdeB family chaperone [Xanthobacteraceae bacterium]